MHLNEMAQEAHHHARTKGFHSTRRDPTVALMLMVTELAEACEELRKGFTPREMYGVDGKPEGVPFELADVVIRIGDFCGEHGIDLDKAVQIKLDYNRSRKYKHGKVF